MSIFKPLFTALLVITSLAAFAQSNEAVFMKWKIKPGDSIVYKTIMDEIDTANAKFSISGMAKSMGNDSINKEEEKIFKQLRNGLKENSEFITILKENRKGFIDIEMHGIPDKNDTSNFTSKPGNDQQNFRALMKQALSGVTLRGAIYEDGSIQSFYTKSAQKNLIAAMFQLPGKSVKVGDSWPIDVNFIGMDQSFICDSSFKKNKVIVTDISNTNNEHVVTLKYDIVEFITGDFISPFDSKPIKTTMTYSHQGIAHFSIERGKWIDYNCVMSNISTGAISSQIETRLSLLPE